MLKFIFVEVICASIFICVRHVHDIDGESLLRELITPTIAKGVQGLKLKVDERKSAVKQPSEAIFIWNLLYSTFLICSFEYRIYNIYVEL